MSETQSSTERERLLEVARKIAADAPLPSAPTAEQLAEIRRKDYETRRRA